MTSLHSRIYENLVACVASLQICKEMALTIISISPLLVYSPHIQAPAPRPHTYTCDVHVRRYTYSRTQQGLGGRAHKSVLSAALVPPARASTTQASVRRSRSTQIAPLGPRALCVKTRAALGPGAPRACQNEGDPGAPCPSKARQNQPSPGAQGPHFVKPCQARQFPARPGASTPQL